MVNTNKLKGAMLSAGFKNVEEAARAIGMTPMTMYRKLKKGVFNSDEILDMIKTYGITNERDIFFVEQ